MDWALACIQFPRQVSRSTLVIRVLGQSADAIENTLSSVSLSLSSSATPRNSRKSSASLNQPVTIRCRDGCDLGPVGGSVLLPGASLLDGAAGGKLPSADGTTGGAADGAIMGDIICVDAELGMNTYIVLKDGTNSTGRPEPTPTAIRSNKQYRGSQHVRRCWTYRIWFGGMGGDVAVTACRYSVEQCAKSRRQEWAER